MPNQCRWRAFSDEMLYCTRRFFPPTILLTPGLALLTSYYTVSDRKTLEQPKSLTTTSVASSDANIGWVHIAAVVVVVVAMYVVAEPGEKRL